MVYLQFATRFELSVSVFRIGQKSLEERASTDYNRSFFCFPPFFAFCSKMSHYMKFLRHKIRVGGHGDGPKWICNPHRLSASKDCLIYSIGSAGVYTWEDALVHMLSKHCEIHVFDTSKKYARPNDPDKRNIHYHNWGLKSSYADGKSSFYNKNEAHVLKTFPETLKELGHESRHIDILKIDCEGCVRVKLFRRISFSPLSLTVMELQQSLTPQNRNGTRIKIGLAMTWVK